jgi:hypothetical protein
MQSNPIPTPMFYNKRDYLVANGQELFIQSLEQMELILCHLQLYTDCPFHKEKNYANTLFYLQFKMEGRQFLPALKDWVSLPSNG